MFDMDRVGSMLDRDGGKDRMRTLETGCGDGVREQIFVVVFFDKHMFEHVQKKKSQLDC